jgi:ribosomal protein S18 acetylase RimI-like enzyme
VAENAAAISLYKSLGFTEFGRNPRGFNSRISGYQELVYMLLEL